MDCIIDLICETLLTYFMRLYLLFNYLLSDIYHCTCDRCVVSVLIYGRKMHVKGGRIRNLTCTYNMFSILLLNELVFKIFILSIIQLLYLLTFKIICDPSIGFNLCWHSTARKG